MKAGWKIMLAVVVAVVALPLAASAGHGHHHHRGGGYGYGYGGGCGCGGQVQYAPPVHAQYGQPTPAVAEAGAGYQSFSYSPTPAGSIEAAQPARVMSAPTYYQPAATYAPNYYGGYSGHTWGARAFNNAANKTLGHNDYGLGRR